MLFAIGLTVGALTLQTLDGHQLLLDNYANRRGTLLVFLSGQSPAAERSIDDLLRVHEKYRRKDVLFVGICANDQETAEQMKAFCLKHEIDFPVYRDSGGAIAKKLGAKYTLETFLLDSRSALRYHGTFYGPDAAKNMDDTLQRFIESRRLPRKGFVASGDFIDQPGPPTSALDPVEPIAFSSEMIFEKIPGTCDHHCSTLAEAPNGDLLCVWFGGSYECADDEVLFISRKKKGERSWSTPQVLTCGELFRPPGNAVIFKVSPTRLMVCYDRLEGRRPFRCGFWGGGGRLMFKCSEDSGYTWTDDAEFPIKTGGMRNAPTTLRSGDLYLPVSGGNGCFLITSDQGQNWRLSGSIGNSGQPTMIERKDRSLLCYLRDEPYIKQSESFDKGQTWTRPKRTSLKCPHAGIAMCKLRNGHTVLVFDDSKTKRTPLSIALSKDDGALWSEPVMLEPNPGEYAYPCVIQTEDGLIHVSYTFLRKTIKHAEFNERWISLLTPEK